MQDRESSPVKDQRSTTIPRNQPTAYIAAAAAADIGATAATADQP